ncbi:hypothetical protein ACSBR1_022528 [Camellia fascicularis]
MYDNNTRRKELRKIGRGKQVPPEEPKPPRETHKLLQVLGGTAKRKKLLSPKGMDVRPMMEVVKGAAFDILQAASGCLASLRPGRWLDFPCRKVLRKAERFVDGPFDYISVTPLYTEVDYGVLMDQVSKSSVVGEDTFIVVEYPLRTNMLDSCGCLIKVEPDYN